jgi:hypothetical protein
VLVPSGAEVMGCAEAEPAAALSQPRMNNHASIGSLLAVIFFKVRSYLSLLFLLIKISPVKKIFLFFIPELMGGEAEGNVFLYK